MRDADTGGQVSGIEDLAVDTATGTVFLSAYDRRAVARQLKEGGARLAQGGLYALPLSGIGEEAEVAARRVRRVAAGAADFHPHGIGLWAGRPRTLFVIDRVYERAGDGWRLSPRVEIGRLDAASRRLSPAGPHGVVADPALCAPNDVVALDENRFLVTDDHGSCGGAGRLLEDALGLARSSVHYYDGSRLRRVIEGIDFANGVAIGPPGAPEWLYVAATRGRGLLVYRLADVLHAARPLRTPLAVLPVGAGLDNLAWGDDGRLYAARHASLLRYALFRRGWTGRSPSRVVRWSTHEVTPAAQLVYAADGALVSGLTVATFARGRLLAAGAFADRLLVCRS